MSMACTTRLFTEDAAQNGGVHYDGEAIAGTYRRLAGSNVYERADTLNGSAQGDTIEAGDEDDAVRARDGDDHILAGRGRDKADAENGDDLVEGGAGTDILIGEVGDDRLFADARSDIDIVFDDGGATDATRDWLAGGPGDDLLAGSPGENGLSGGVAADDPAAAERDLTASIHVAGPRRCHEARLRARWRSVWIRVCA